MKVALATLAILCATPAVAWDFRGSINSPKVYSPQGEYLGNLNANEFDPNSIANPHGRYGSEFSPSSINNPFGRNGNIFDAFKDEGNRDDR